MNPPDEITPSSANRPFRKASELIPAPGAPWDKDLLHPFKAPTPSSSSRRLSNRKRRRPPRPPTSPSARLRASAASSSSHSGPSSQVDSSRLDAAHPTQQRERRRPSWYYLDIEQGKAPPPVPLPRVIRDKEDLISRWIADQTDRVARMMDNRTNAAPSVRGDLPEREPIRLSISTTQTNETESTLVPHDHARGKNLKRKASSCSDLDVRPYPATSSLLHQLQRQRRRRQQRLLISPSPSSTPLELAYLPPELHCITAADPRLHSRRKCTSAPPDFNCELVPRVNEGDDEADEEEVEQQCCWNSSQELERRGRAVVDWLAEV